MLLNILPNELLEIAKEISKYHDLYNQWACKHIVIELSDFLNDNPELQYICKAEKGYHYAPELEKDHYLNYDGYWMLQCENEEEVKDLLNSWYLERDETELHREDEKMTFRELLQSVNIDEVCSIIENELWDSEEPCPIDDYRYTYNKLLTLPIKKENDQIIIYTIEDDEIGGYVYVENCELDPWENSINKMVTIIDEASLSLEQIVAYCLWYKHYIIPQSSK